MKDNSDVFFDEGYLKVSLIHEIYYRQYGNPNGEPVLWLHGGPGTGCQYTEAKFFNLSFFRLILFDQRGAGKSLPFCELTDNTTKDLISDIELLRIHLGIKKWSIVGGSWGTLLAMCYAIEYPERIKVILLRGVFLGSENESLNLWYGMRDTFPDIWEEFFRFIPEEESKDFVLSYRSRILCTNAHISLPAIDAFYKYDCICSWHHITQKELIVCLSNQKAKVGCAKLFCHYDANHYFIVQNYILNNIYRIQHLPCVIVHGRYDTICRVSVAYHLHKLWKNSQLCIVANGGHTIQEKEMFKALRMSVKVLQKMLLKLNNI